MRCVLHGSDSFLLEFGLKAHLDITLGRCSKRILGWTDFGVSVVQIVARPRMINVTHDEFDTLNSSPMHSLYLGEDITQQNQLDNFKSNMYEFVRKPRGLERRGLEYPVNVKFASVDLGTSRRLFV